MRCALSLGIARIECQGDSDLIEKGGGTGGSRSVTAEGTAVLAAPEVVVERGRRVVGEPGWGEHAITVCVDADRVAEGEGREAGQEAPIDRRIGGAPDHLDEDERVALELEDVLDRAAGNDTSGRPPEAPDGRVLVDLEHSRVARRPTPCKLLKFSKTRETRS